MIVLCELSLEKIESGGQVRQENREQNNSKTILSMESGECRKQTRCTSRVYACECG